MKYSSKMKIYRNLIGSIFLTVLLVSCSNSKNMQSSTANTDDGYYSSADEKPASRKSKAAVSPAPAQNNYPNAQNSYSAPNNIPNQGNNYPNNDPNNYYYDNSYSGGGSSPYNNYGYNRNSYMYNTPGMGYGYSNPMYNPSMYGSCSNFSFGMNYGYGYGMYNPYMYDPFFYPSYGSFYSPYYSPYYMSPYYHYSLYEPYGGYNSNPYYGTGGGSYGSGTSTTGSSNTYYGARGSTGGTGSHFSNTPVSRRPIQIKRAVENAPTYTNPSDPRSTPTYGNSNNTPVGNQQNYNGSRTYSGTTNGTPATNNNQPATNYGRPAETNNGSGANYKENNSNTQRTYDNPRTYQPSAPSTPSYSQPQYTAPKTPTYSQPRSNGGFNGGGYSRPSGGGGGGSSSGSRGSRR